MAKEENKKDYYSKCDPDLDVKFLKALWRALNSPRFKITI